MAELTPEGQHIVEDAARRYGMSIDAVRVLLEALVASGGGMAQFNHPDLGGMGQWSGGGDDSNNKATADGKSFSALVAHLGGPAGKPLPLWEVTRFSPRSHAATVALTHPWPGVRPRRSTVRDRAGTLAGFATHPAELGRLDR